MDITTLEEDDLIQYLDRDGITREGIVRRNRITESNRHFLTVESFRGPVEVIRDPTKVLKKLEGKPQPISQY